MTEPLLPDPHDPHTDYLRRTAEAAEATRRNSRILVVALAAFVAAVAVTTAAIIGLQTGRTYGSTLAAAEELTGIGAVEATARTVGYTPPAYTTIANQVRGICDNLAQGKTITEAAVAMATGFGEGMGLNQASAIVESAQREAC